MSQKSLFLVPFPFSDQSGKKVRPVLIVSNEDFNNSSEDVIVCAITSNISKEKYSVVVTKSSLVEGALFNDCCVKVENILKVDKTLLIKKIGKLNDEIFSLVLKKISTLF